MDGMPNPELVSAADVDQWAGSLAARSTLPRLVRRLILANTSVTKVAMRAGEGTGIPGWDGLVEASVGDAHVPKGVSRWEMSSGEDPQDKAQENYRKRTANPQDVDPALTTFVFVTPRIWRERDDWVQRRKADARWADIRAYDADDLETWLERTPSVHIWMSELLGRDPRDVKTIDSWWDTWANQTAPALPAAFILAGRADVPTGIDQALNGPPTMTPVIAQSRDEATACTVAALLELSGDQESLAARALVVSGISAWDRIIDSPTPLILIPIVDDVDIPTAVRKGHHVFAPLTERMQPRGSGISAAPLDPEAAVEALVQVGVSQDDARRYARQGRRSMLSLRRTIAASPLTRRPDWSRPPSGSRLVSLMLAGSWMADHDGDKTAIEALTGREYPDIETDLAAWSAEEDAPIRRSGRQWQIVAKDDAWDLVSALITQTDIDRFLSTATSVLREHNPALDLEPDKRFMASVLGAERACSNVLREALADSAAFLAGYVAEVPLQPGGTGQQLAARLVYQVLDGANGDPTSRLWPSLADVLPLLAEAAPDVFLDAVETGLSGDPPPLMAFFPDEPTSIFGSTSTHVGLIWALQNLCWSPDYLSRAASDLARLTPFDQGNRSGPHPAEALAQAVNLFLPQTSAPLERRLAVIDGLRRRHADAAWILMRTLLPANFGILQYGHTPRWRTWHHGVSNQINHSDIANGIPEIITRMLDDVVATPHRWTQLVEHIPDLPVAERDRVLAALEALNPSEFDPEDGTATWHAIVALVEKHRRFPSAQWSMPATITDRIDAVAQRFTPEYAVDRYVDLFDHHPYLADVDMDDYPAYNEALEGARRDAVVDLAGTSGLDSVLALGRQVALPYFVGYALADTDRTDLEDPVLSHLGEDGPEGRVAVGFAAGRVDQEHLDWIKAQLDHREKWTPAQRATLLLTPPRTSRAVLDLLAAEDPDVGVEFWKRVDPRFSEMDARADIARALLDRDRPWLAVDVLAGLAVHGGPTPPGLNVELAQSALLAAGLGSSEEIGQISMLAWEAGQLLDYLERSDADPVARARIEFLLLPLLQHTRPAQALSSALQNDPALFVELVTYVSGPEGEPPEEASEQRQAIATYGYNALLAWRTPPGLTEAGTIDEAALKTWVTEARRQLADAKRAEIGDGLIGQVLAHLPPDPDGLWPSRPVRDLIEDLASSRLESGLQNGKVNSRGVQSRDIRAGGDPERSLVKTYRGWATRVADAHPRTAAMLRRIADNYSEWARREDDQSSHFLDQG